MTEGGAPTRARRRGRAGRVRLFAVLPLFVLAVLAGDAVRILAGPGGAPSCPAGTALVMGAAQYAGRPSPAFERRLSRALEAYRSGCVDRIVVSGGMRTGDHTSEGAAGVAWLRRRGVPQAALRAEETATTSAENVARARGMLDSTKVLVVTDDLHAWRSVYLARREGLQAQAVGAPVPSGRLRYALRELVALTSYRLGLAP